MTTGTEPTLQDREDRDNVLLECNGGVIKVMFYQGDTWLSIYTLAGGLQVTLGDKERKALLEALS